jgi:hypothetical protein
MNRILAPDDVVAKLKKAGMTIELCNVGKTVTNDDRKFIEAIGYSPPPPPINQIYDMFDGFALIWRGHISGNVVQGSINILPYAISLSRAPKEETGAPLEGILWTQDTPDELRKLMKKMTIFETVTGRSLFLTYLSGTKDSALSLIARDDAKPIVPTFDEVMSILFTYAGVDGVRELLVHADWHERIAKDVLLQEIEAWA